MIIYGNFRSLIDLNLSYQEV